MVNGEDGHGSIPSLLNTSLHISHTPPISALFFYFKILLLLHKLHNKLHNLSH